MGSGLQNRIWSLEPPCGACKTPYTGSKTLTGRRLGRSKTGCKQPRSVSGERSVALLGHPARVPRFSAELPLLLHAHLETCADEVRGDLGEPIPAGAGLEELGR